MKYLIISFKSRNDIYGFAKILKTHNIYLSIINSPKSVGSSCMLSIKTNFINLEIISQLLSKFQPKSFLGLYSVQQTSNGEQIFKLM